MLSKMSSMRNEKGFTLIELLIVIAIIGILAAIAIPQFNAYKKRAADADVKANLHNLYLACKSYWGDTDGGQTCDIAKAVETDANGNLLYGFIQSTNVELNPATGTETTWASTGQHSFGQYTWTQNSVGNITKGILLP